MNSDNLLAASVEVAQSICACMDGVRTTNPGLDPIYAICLAVSDDFANLALYANTTSHFRESDGGMLDKWYFAKWWSEGMDIATDSLVQHHGDVNDIDETPESDNGPYWLAAMTNAMLIAKNQNAFRMSDVSPFLFCSMIDSSNAVWLEDASARFLNSIDSYNKFAPELAAAQVEWYFDAAGRNEYKAAFENVLQQILNSR